MKRRLRDELQQTRPFSSLEEEVYVELLHTSQTAARWIAEALRPASLTPSQFNVLRILRGARPDGLPSGHIAERMVNHDPDVTRLLDRLEARGLIEKTRSTVDRRVVNSCITTSGVEIVESASDSVRDRLKIGLRGLNVRQLEALADLLELVRAGNGAPAASNVETTRNPNPGERHGHEEADHPRHRSDGPARRSGRPRVARETPARGTRDDAPAGRRRGAGAGEARRRDRRG